MTGIFYLRARGALPPADDVEGMAKYWKRNYNTFLGKGKPEEFVRNYRELVKS